ncbi:MAG TPA: type II secretion system F family protein [Rhizomicrobium sp.]|nr:type II secretion system F family protein [Rhizomicrobium sp.]
MLNVGIFEVLFDPDFVATALAAIVVFATIATLGVPLMERNTLTKRLKTVSVRREELRARHHASLQKRASLRTEPIGFMKETLERFNLANMLESPDTRDKLARAGYRGQAPLIAFMFFRFAMPFIVFVCALIYFYGISNYQWPALTKFCVSLGIGIVGYYLPDVYLSNVIARRQESIMQAFPDGLDLMLICVESGMSIEATFTRVASEIGSSSAELAEELALTTAELSYLPDRSQAFDNLARRTGHPGVKAVATALNQAEHYGTPMGQALRVTAQENREQRMANAEKKAAALPAKLTVPMILFFLPCLFVVILGPAIMKIMHTIH